ncbi:glycosyltransferase family A protein [Xanthomonas nasturtii]|uniref:Glycosyltransferase family 2 protein n=1 Tax=Xanthomonas nasturtii TaxID=1843581 RepID=A0ABT0LUQ0_9XANT|nr:glycosyltransferase family 2 protein [Xanthomonas nasturtii]MCL1556572.1 glycosyltransferase family 2 protein [Xanthomonas nasturtii]
MPLTHSFVVLVYGQSPHLADCLRSLAAQTLPSPVIISTSTPFEELSAVAGLFGARLHVHGPNLGIGRDWNAALDVADTDLVTLVHQDDLYAPGFAAETLDAFAQRNVAAFAFCDSNEVRGDGSRRQLPFNHWIKQILVTIATWPGHVVHGGLRRRLLLGFGNPVICASVTLNRRQWQTFRFREDLRTNMDWMAWLQLSEQHTIVRVGKRLVTRRVHAQSATSQCLADGARLVEDRLVLGKLWPAPVAALILYFYRLSYSGYDS